MDGDHFVSVSVIAGFAKVCAGFHTEGGEPWNSPPKNLKIYLLYMSHAGQEVNYRCESDNGGYQR